jgi:hypothetical protein
MPVKAVILNVSDYTKKKLKGFPPEEWVPAQVEDTLSDWDETEDRPTKVSYKVALVSKAEIYFHDEDIAVNMHKIVGPVAYMDTHDNWIDVTGSPDINNRTVKAVDTGDEGSVSVNVLDGSRGIYRPPQW